MIFQTDQDDLEEGAKVKKHFKIDGVISDTAGIKVLEIKRPLMPAVKNTYEDIPGVEGSILVDSEYDDFKIDVRCALVFKDFKNPSAKRLELRKVKRFLRIRDTRFKLSFYDEEGYYYEANIDAHTFDERFFFEEFTITFMCRPFLFTDEVFTKTGEGITLTLEQGGDYVALPNIIILSKTDVSNFTIDVNDRVFKILQTKANVPITIDSEALTVKEGENHIENLIHGYFPIFENSNTITFSHVVQYNISYHERYLP